MDWSLLGDEITSRPRFDRFDPSRTNVGHKSRGRQTKAWIFPEIPILHRLSAFDVRMDAPFRSNDGRLHLAAGTSEINAGLMQLVSWHHWIRRA